MVVAGSASTTRIVASANSSGLAQSVSPPAATRFPGVITGSDGLSTFTAMP